MHSNIQKYGIHRLSNTEEIMGMEIERKFLVKTLPNLAHAEKHEIVQCYVQTSPVEIRARAVDNQQFFLTKKQGTGLARKESEKEITKEKFEKFLTKARDRFIEKTRYIFSLTEYVAEIDVFEGKHRGLMLVEVEFPTVDEAENFTPPVWFGREVTTDKRFKNSNLALNPFTPKTNNF